MLSPKNYQNQNDEKICWCKISNKKNNPPKNGLTCCYCKYVTHKKCAIYKAANKFTCSECQSDMFPLTNIQDHDMLDLTFNSNFQCICLENQVQTSNREEPIQKLPSFKQLNFIEKT